jgi:hypothetical protein
MSLGGFIPPPKGGGRSAKPTGWGRKHWFPGANNPTPRTARATLPFQGREKR